MALNLFDSVFIPVRNHQVCIILTFLLLDLLERVPLTRQKTYNMKQLNQPTAPPRGGRHVEVSKLSQ
jgi:hypothetical protein